MTTRLKWLALLLAAAGAGKASARTAAKPMDHGNMKMQGGTAPADARDPHGYSDGSTLDSGPYVLAGPRRLRHADEHNFGSVLVDRLAKLRQNQ